MDRGVPQCAPTLPRGPPRAPPSPGRGPRVADQRLCISGVLTAESGVPSSQGEHDLRARLAGSPGTAANGRRRTERPSTPIFPPTPTPPPLPPAGATRRH